MATYGPMVLTTAGQALYAKVQTGTTLTFTRMQIGSGQLATTLTSALAKGTSYSSLSVAALPRAVANGDTIIIGPVDDGAGTNTSISQNVTVSSAASAGATTIDVTAFTSNADYASGTVVTDITDAASLTALITPIDYFDINSETTSGSTANVRGIYQNTNLTASTYTSELGLFAQDPTAGEILYAYTNAGTLGDTFPPYSSGPYSRQFQIATAVGNATSVTANVPSTVYVTQSEVGAANGVVPLNANVEIDAKYLVNAPQPSNATPTTPGLIQLAGDLTGTAAAPVLTTTGVTAGTYPKVTVDAKGRVTSGSALASGDVTVALGFTPLSTTGQAASAAELNDYNGGHSIKATWTGSVIEFEVDNSANESVSNANNATNLGGQAPSYYATASSSAANASASGTWTPHGIFIANSSPRVWNIASIPSGAKSFIVEWNNQPASGVTPQQFLVTGLVTGSTAYNYWVQYQSSTTSGILVMSLSTGTGSINIVISDGTNTAYGYFQINGGYLQFYQTDVVNGSGGYPTIGWAVS